MIYLIFIVLYKLMKYLNLLPDDIIDYIYTLIYFTQSPFLISDIKHYFIYKLATNLEPPLDFYIFF